MAEERATTTVLTSENSGEFYAAKLGLPEPTEDPGNTETPADAAKAEPAAEEVDADLKDPDQELPEHRRKPIAPRIKELTDKVKAERAEKAALATEKADLAKEIAELRAKLNPPPKPTPDAEPDPTAFTDQKEYAKAYSAWDKLQESKKVEQTKRIETWKEATDRTRAKATDFDQAIAAAANAQVVPHIAEAILEAGALGPEFQYYFAKNPAILESLNAMSERQAMREMGKIEAQLTAAPVKEAPEPVVIRRSAPAAADPITPIRGGKTTVESEIGSDGEFHGSFEQYKAARKAGRIK